MAAKRAVGVFERCSQLVRPMEAPALDDHHALFPRGAEGRHHLMDIVTPLLRRKRGDDFIADGGGPILHSATDREQPATREAAPGAGAPPRLAFAGRLPFALALGERTRGPARTLRCAPPACPGQGAAPPEGVVFIAQQARPAAGLLCEGGECDRRIRKVGRVGSKSAGRTAVGQRVFFRTPRPRCRPSWPPVCCAHTAASARPLHCA